MDNSTGMLSDITARLASISDTPALDASVLLAHVVNKPRTWVVAHPEVTLTDIQQGQLHNSLTRLENGEPLPYVLGRWEFFGMEFNITPDVLIPRPETEMLVEKAIAWLQESTLRKTVADVGTGSGVIGISIAAYVPDAHIIATDISEKAIRVAQKNAQRFNVKHQIEFVHCDLLPTNSQRNLDLICANLPYIPTETLHSLPIYGREPFLALDGGQNGLDLIHRLLKLAADLLAPDGLVLLEIEATQGVTSVHLASNIFPNARIRLHQDLTGHDRLLEIAI